MSRRIGFKCMVKEVCCEICSASFVRQGKESKVVGYHSNLFDLCMGQPIIIALSAPCGLSLRKWGLRTIANMVYTVTCINRNLLLLGSEPEVHRLSLSVSRSLSVSLSLFFVSCLLLSCRQDILCKTKQSVLIFTCRTLFLQYSASTCNSHRVF